MIIIVRNFSNNVKILYVIRSISKYYDDRLKSQYDTWMKLLNENESVLVASIVLNIKKFD